MNHLPLWWMLTPILGLLGCITIWWLYRLGQQVTLERAREAFFLQRDLLPNLFLQAANATGKPKGLRWKSCQLLGEPLIQRHKPSGMFLANILMEIEFEAIVGGDMVDNPSAEIPRTITGVFLYVRGHWTSDGKAIFNQPGLKSPRDSAPDMNDFQAGA